MLFKNGIIHDGNGNIYNKDILIEDNKIVAIGNNLSSNDGTLDCSDKHIFPGFIDSMNVYGVRGPGWGDSDGSELSDPLLPQMDITYSFDHDGMNFQELYRFGVTSVGIVPTQKNVISGQMAVYKTFGDNPYKMLVKDKVAMIVAINSGAKGVYGSENKKPMTKMGSVSLLIEILEKTKYYTKDSDYDPKLEAMKPVLNGEMPLFINCASKSELNTVSLALKEYKDLDIVINGAYGIDNEFMDRNKDYKILMGNLVRAYIEDTLNINYKDIIDIQKNYPLAITNAGNGDNISSGQETLLWNAMLWYKNGMDSEEVLKSITSIPAKILGVEDRIGSIDIGKDADFSIWTDNPIKKHNAKVEMVYLDGENVLERGVRKSCW